MWLSPLCCATMLATLATATSSKAITLSGDVVVQNYDFMTEGKPCEKHVHLETRTPQDEIVRVQLKPRSETQNNTFYRKFLGLDSVTMLVEPIGDATKGGIPLEAFFVELKGTATAGNAHHKYVRSLEKKRLERRQRRDSVPSQPLGPETAQGARSVLVVIANFLAEPTTIWDVATVNAAIKQSVGTWPTTVVAGADPRDGTSFSDQIDKGTYGKVTFPDGSITIMISDVAGTSTAYNANPSSSCDADEITDDVLADLGLSEGDYDHVHVITPSVFSGDNCPLGLGNIGGGRSWTFLSPSTGFSVRSLISTMAHEFGHNFGLSHAGCDLNNDGVQESEYCDQTDVMGASNNGGFAAMSKHYLQVIDDTEIIDLASSVEGALHPTAADSGTYTLRGIDFSEDGGNYPCGCTADASIIKVPRSATTQITDGNTAFTGMATEYVISYRSNDLLGTYATATYREKVFIHYRPPFHFYADMELVAVLSVGETFTDATANFGVTFTSIDGVDGKTADVTLDFTGSSPHLHSADNSCTFQSTGYPCFTDLGVAGTCTHSTALGACTAYSGGDGPNLVGVSGSFGTGLYLRSETTACNGRPVWQRQTGTAYMIVWDADMEGWVVASPVSGGDVCPGQNRHFATSFFALAESPFGFANIDPWDAGTPAGFFSSGNTLQIEATTAAPSTVPPATAAPTSAAPTSTAPTTAAPTTATPTTQAPTSAAPTSAAPTTAAPTTQAPTSLAPTSAAPTTATPTTQAPTTRAPTSAAPTSAAPTTATPTTPAPTSVAPTSAAPTEPTGGMGMGMGDDGMGMGMGDGGMGMGMSGSVTDAPTMAPPTRAPTRPPTRAPTQGMGMMGMSDSSDSGKMGMSAKMGMGKRNVRAVGATRAPVEGSTGQIQMAAGAVLVASVALAAVVARN
eukprot:m.340167 g.340167  ORF g.340167 m.340167 type:complete len:910 (+) comp20591_c0_seq8:81-2810(+)